MSYIRPSSKTMLRPSWAMDGNSTRPSVNRVTGWAAPPSRPRRQMFSAPPFPEDKVNCIKVRDLEIPYWLLTYEELIELLIDMDDPNASVQIAFLRGVLLELKREANAHLNLGHITVDSPIYFDMDDLVKRFK